MAFHLSKLFWLVASPTSILTILLGVGLIAAAAGRRRGAIRCLGVAAALLLLVAILPLGAWLLLPLEERFDRPEPMPERVDGIILLGGAVQPSLSAARGVPALNDLAERLTAFLALARRHEDARLVFTGGSGALFGSPMSEAEVARDLLEGLGLPPERVTWEDRSRDTYENAVFSLALAEPRAGETWLLVTSAMHMPRAVGAFRAAGWPALLPYPSDYLTKPRPDLLDFDLASGLFLLDRAAHEWTGLVAYRLMGRSTALFPAP
jgi:uncharacterized SAM-binding protein YcdF (DUF218 family)